MQAFLDLHPNYLPEGWPSRAVPPPTSTPTPTDHSPSARSVWGLLHHPSQSATANPAWRCLWLGVLAVAAATMLWAYWEVPGNVTSHLNPHAHEPEAALVAHFEELSTITRSDAAYLKRAQTESALGDSSIEVGDELGLNAAAVHLPVGSNLRVRRNGSFLRIEIPPLRLHDPEVVYGGVFASLWLGFTTVWTTSAVRQGAPVIFVVFSAPFWFVGAHLVHQTLVPAMETITLTMDDVRFELGREWRGMDVSRHGGFTLDLMPAQVVASSAVVTANEQVQNELRLFEGINHHVMGKHLKTLEIQHLQHEINAFLRDARAIRFKTRAEHEIPG